ncbi:S1C family serine protease [Neorhodopirellula pilleata]|uniref:Serine protease Do-like HtrB n=1 Tax=Neorhodopirellula pilleata TaxID=2714738 RepID=A0A5C6AQN1_9BACT|nr:trypsin-like peptidase domain-containing protein [Neorhodopirellula pilleata]TWU01529.1 Serine protease Do-like HtrB [Neorhodopirellula pilleata]
MTSLIIDPGRWRLALVMPLLFLLIVFGLGSFSIAPELQLIAGPPALGPEVPKSLDPIESAVTYLWEPDQRLVYEFEIEAEVGSHSVSYRGRNSIRPTVHQPIVIATEEETGEGSGSGFVIHPEGVVVTCAHVVKGATSIRATVGETQFDATVIQLDFANDLAVLRLDGQDLPYVKFADSDDVRLGEEVRAIGYPLSDVLGETIKVSKGEISGRGGLLGTDALQIDATINPGNSGGPLVDDSARLIGVTNSMLAGTGISEVGFAIPSNKVIEMVNKLDIPIEKQTEPKVLSAPDAIDRISAATVLLKVQMGPKGLGIERPHELTYSSYWYTSSSSASASIYLKTPQHEHHNGTIQIDSSGKTIRDDEQAMLPLLLGNVSRVGIEMLPNSSPGRTVSTSLLVFPEINARQRNMERDPYGFDRFASRHRAPWIRQQVPPRTSNAIFGTETTTIVLGEPSPEGIEVNKTYSIHVEGETKDTSPLNVTGSGKGMFDPIARRMKNMDYEMTIKVHQDNLTLRIPISMTYRLLDDAMLEKERIDAEALKKKQQQDSARASGFRSLEPPERASNDDAKTESVKEIPESSSLNQFDFDQ